MNFHLWIIEPRTRRLEHGLFDWISLPGGRPQSHLTMVFYNFNRAYRSDGASTWTCGKRCELAPDAWRQPQPARREPGLPDNKESSVPGVSRCRIGPSVGPTELRTADGYPRFFSSGPATSRSG